MRAAERVRWFARGLGQLLITAGVVVLLFCVYELKVTDAYAAGQQDKLTDSLTRQWTEPAQPQGPVVPQTALGKAFARIYFPTLGKDQVRVVVEGVGVEDLKKGPGHYPGTALPGQLGNLVISGHRTTYGAPFRRVDDLDRGDAIVVETRSAYFTYRVRRVFPVSPKAVEVTYPVPYRREAVPRERLLTLTTCHPPYSAKQRLIVQAVLFDTVAKAPGVVPPALRAG
jgi:sortase A